MDPNFFHNKHVAWVANTKNEDSPTVYWAEAPDPHFFPFSEVTELVQGVWQQHSKIARHILRNRIFITRIQGLSDFERGMIRVAAKRLSHGSPSTHLDPNITWTFKQIYFLKSFEFEAPLVQVENWRDMTKELQNQSTSEPLYLQDRKVAAAVVDANLGKMLLTQNRNHSNRTLHAELLLVLNLLRNPDLLTQADFNEIWITLKPCRMCSALITTILDPALTGLPNGLKIQRVLYDLPDNGPLSLKTTLDEPKTQQKLQIDFGQRTSQYPT